MLMPIVNLRSVCDLLTIQWHALSIEPGRVKVGGVAASFLVHIVDLNALYYFWHLHKSGGAFTRISRGLLTT